jgi:hypothetical protein
VLTTVCCPTGGKVDHSPGPPQFQQGVSGVSFHLTSHLWQDSQRGTWGRMMPFILRGYSKRPPPEGEGLKVGQRPELITVGTSTTSRDLRVGSLGES